MSSVTRRSGTKLLRAILRALDPAAEAGRFLLYSKTVAGVTQLFGRSSDGVVHQITPQASDIIVFGNGNIASAADTRFLAPYYVDAQAGTSIIELVAPRGGVLRSFYVRHNEASGDGDPVVYTVYVNGIATAITTTLATGAVGTASDLVHSAVVAQGDRIAVEAFKAADITNGFLEVVATMALGQV